MRNNFLGNFSKYLDSFLFQHLVTLIVYFLYDPVTFLSLEKTLLFLFFSEIAFGLCCCCCYYDKFTAVSNHKGGEVGTRWVGQLQSHRLCRLINDLHVCNLFATSRRSEEPCKDQRLVRVHTL